VIPVLWSLPRSPTTRITGSASTCSRRCTWQDATSWFRVVGEVAYLLARTGGARTEAQFLTSLAERTFSTVELTVDDYRRAAELVLTYEDLPLGTTDATVIALCERLGLSEVATLDRRHFTVVRPRHVEALTLLPE
jgi:predicted nucleic acid-binding protein